MLSIITDFGCSKSCPYCIHRQQLRATPAHHTPEYLDSLELVIRNTGGEVFSISGGGDPLHNFESHYSFWHTIQLMCSITNKRIDIHTAYLNEMIHRFSFFESFLRKIALHCFPETWDQDKENVRTLHALSPQSRVNFVTDYTLQERAPDIEAFCHQNQIPFSYREIVDPEVTVDTAFFESVHDRTPFGHYIHQADYNVYFTPAGELKLRYTEV